MRSKKNIFGRSMVEILAIISIVGVLSIGAVVALRQAFDTRQTNGVLENVRLAAYLVEFDDVLPKLGENYSTIPVKNFPQGSNFDIDMSLTKISSDRFALHVYDVSKNVCHMLFQRMITTADYVIANPSVRNGGTNPADKCMDGSNTISYYFHLPIQENVCCSENPDVVVPPPSQNGCSGNTDCSGCHNCVSGKCVYQCSAGQTCQNGSCVTASTCNEANCSGCSVCEGDSCVDKNELCPSNQVCTSGSCACPAEFPYWQDGLCGCNPGDVLQNGKCVTLCDSSNCTGCASCVNGICTADSAFCSGGRTCVAQVNGAVTNGVCTCPAQKPVWNEQTETCECEANSIVIDDACYSCSISNNYFFNEAQCAECSESREWLNAPGGCFLKCGNEQSATSYFRDLSYECYRCDTSKVITATAAECTSCPNRSWTEQGNICTLECSAGQFESTAHYCIDCEHIAGIVASKEECTKCENRTWVDGTCWGNCGPGQFRDAEGVCNDCTASIAYPATLDECNKCSSKNYLRYWFPDDGKCYPSARMNYFMGETTATTNAVQEYSCEDKYPRITSAAQCQLKCIDAGYDRVYNSTDSQCFPPCVKEGTGLQIRLVSGQCYNCPALGSGGKETTSAECDKCVQNQNLWGIEFEYLSKKGYCATTCEAGKFRDGGEGCRSCDNAAGQPADKAPCLSCNNGQAVTLTWWSAGTGRCYQCNKGANYQSTLAECQVCKMADGKYQRYYQNGSCYYCAAGSADGLTCP